MRSSFLSRFSLGSLVLSFFKKSLVQSELEILNLPWVCFSVFLCGLLINWRLVQVSTCLQPLTAGIEIEPTSLWHTRRCYQQTHLADFHFEQFDGCSRLVKLAAVFIPLLFHLSALYLLISLQCYHTLLGHTSLALSSLIVPLHPSFAFFSHQFIPILPGFFYHLIIGSTILVLCVCVHAQH